AAGRNWAAPVSSRTFALVHEYAGRLPVFHVDAYRLRHLDEALDLGLPEAQPYSVILIEWPEQIGPALPADRLEIELLPTRDDERRVTARGTGERARAILDALA